MAPPRDLLSPAGVLCGWLAAAVTLPTVLLVAAVGQGVGAALGGCSWIGISLPVHRAVWALVNQPVINFAVEWRSLGYWLGSTIAPLMVAAVTGIAHRRPASVGASLLVIQLAFFSVTLGVAWLPLLEPTGGHVQRWLALWRLPSVLLWGLPAVAAVAALPAALRLLALARVARPHSGRGARCSLVLLHFGVPLLAWAAAVWWLRGTVPAAALFGASVPLAATLAIAWFRYPQPYPHRISEIDGRQLLALLLGAAMLAALLWSSGRPLPDGHVAGLLWADPKRSNNIRDFIEPTRPLAKRRGGV